MFNRLICQDNLTALQELLEKGYQETIDLCYIDPPFCTQKDFSAYNDKWESIDHYIDYIQQRVKLIYLLLKPTGSFYLHCDPTASHYLKVAMDKIFQYKNCRNEIIWYYTNSGGRGKKRFSKKHDIIFFYSKTDNYTFNGNAVTIPRAVGKTSRGGVIAFDDDGREYQEIQSNGKRYRYYFDEGKIPEDVWTIQPIAPHHPERTGYPTQKPLILLERIIQASSNEGDVVLDAFMGSGTTILAAQKLNRKWIGIDNNQDAVDLVYERLTKSEVNDKSKVDILI